MVEIVGDDEEPRASTITKSSTSSETPTILADHSGAILTIPPPTQASLMTPTTYAASTFSTPDFTRRQGSFDTSRLGTSASSMTDCRTMSSFAPDHVHPHGTSVDDIPSLTSSRSTMISSMHHGASSRRDASDRSVSSGSTQPPTSMEQSERRRKRSSIQSLTKLVGASFGESKSKLQLEGRPQTSSATQDRDDKKRKKEHRLSRLMFWKNKQSSSIGSSSK